MESSRAVERILVAISPLLVVSYGCRLFFLGNIFDREEEQEGRGYHIDGW